MDTENKKRRECNENDDDDDDGGGINVKGVTRSRLYCLDKEIAPMIWV